LATISPITNKANPENFCWIGISLNCKIIKQTISPTVMSMIQRSLIKVPAIINKHKMQNIHAEVTALIRVIKSFSLLIKYVLLSFVQYVSIVKMILQALLNPFFRIFSDENYRWMFVWRCSLRNRG